jgi:hypothetical protein
MLSTTDKVIYLSSASVVVLVIVLLFSDYFSRQAMDARAIKRANQRSLRKARKRLNKERSVQKE